MKRKIAVRDTRLPRWVLILGICGVLALSGFLALHGAGLAPTGHATHAT